MRNKVGLSILAFWLFGLLQPGNPAGSDRNLQILQSQPFHPSIRPSLTSHPAVRPASITPRIPPSTAVRSPQSCVGPWPRRETNGRASLRLSLVSSPTRRNGRSATSNPSPRIDRFSLSLLRIALDGHADAGLRLRRRPGSRPMPGRATRSLVAVDSDSDWHWHWNH